MNTTTIYLVFALVVVLTILISSVIAHQYFKRNSYVLVQGKGKNTDSNLTEAMAHLKVTNMWEAEKVNTVEANKQINKHQ